MTSSWESSQRSKGGLEQLNIFLVVQTLEHSVLPWLGPSPGCTWAGFNPLELVSTKERGGQEGPQGWVGEKSPAQDGARVQIKWLPL